ncbi:MAG: GGDEF domain-containing protein [Lachnospiraceae bacterium]|nr:GGDEF domain-containing protein [Lachnospiraceae bacterium]
MKYYEFLDNEEENEIKRIINNEKEDVIHGIIVFNIDNFVVVNEMFGRSYGDSVIKEVGEKIGKVFRSSDHVIKLRGDEFIVFTHDISELGNIETLAGKLLNTVSSIEVKDSIELTASVGIAIYPFHGTDYAELKNKAYQSMYRAKANGKNRYRIFDSARTKVLYYDYLYNKDKYESNKDAGFFDILDNNMDFFDMCTRMFIEEKDTDSTLNSIMELECVFLGFSRAYIYSNMGLTGERLNKLSYANNGYEFGRESEAFQAIKADMIARLWERYSTLSLIDAEDDLVDEVVREYLNDNGITQMLIYPIFNGEDAVGMLMFENLDADKLEFSTQELYQLDDNFHSIQAYYFNTHDKKNSREQLSKLELFENLDACVYIVNSKTHDIEFANRKAVQSDFGNIIGDKCYSIFRNKEKPCRECPFKKMDINDPKANANIDAFNFANNCWCKFLYSWIDTRDNKGKALIIAVDINNYFGGE